MSTAKRPWLILHVKGRGHYVVPCTIELHALDAVPCMDTDAPLSIRCMMTWYVSFCAMPRQLRCIGMAQAVLLLARALPRAAGGEPATAKNRAAPAAFGEPARCERVAPGDQRRGKEERPSRAWLALQTS